MCGEPARVRSLRSSDAASCTGRCRAEGKPFIVNAERKQVPYAAAGLFVQTLFGLSFDLSLYDVLTTSMLLLIP